MLNQSIKHVNHLSRKKMFDIEKREHGLSKRPSQDLLLKIEKNEHNLSKTPSMSQLLKIEAREHRRKVK